MLFSFGPKWWIYCCFTAIFAEYAYNINGILHTCDISQNNIKNAKAFTKKFNKTKNVLSQIKKYVLQFTRFSIKKYVWSLHTLYYTTRKANYKLI